MAGSRHDDPVRPCANTRFFSQTPVLIGGGRWQRTIGDCGAEPRTLARPETRLISPRATRSALTLASEGADFPSQ